MLGIYVGYMLILFFIIFFINISNYKYIYIYTYTFIHSFEGFFQQIFMLLILINRLVKLHDISLVDLYFLKPLIVLFWQQEKVIVKPACVINDCLIHISAQYSCVRISLYLIVVQEGSGAGGNGQGYDLAGEGGWGMIS